MRNALNRLSGQEATKDKGLAHILEMDLFPAQGDPRRDPSPSTKS